MSTIKVLIVEDMVMLQETLKFFIERDEEIEVVGCARNGKEALALCDLYFPDVVLMDIQMPVCDGVKGTRLIKEKYGQIKVIMLTALDDDLNIAQALQNGADGYILKDKKPTEVITAIKDTVNGLRVIEHKVFETMLKQYKTAANEVVGPKIDLTEKENSVIQLVVNKSNREIAEILCLSEGRVKNIITEILSKLGLEDRTQLAVYAVKNKLV